jgi:hypothetical protein
MSSPTNNAPPRRGRSAAADTRDNSPIQRDNPTFENVLPAQSADEAGHDNPPPTAPPAPAPSASLTGDELRLLLKQVTTNNRPRYQIERRPISLLPAQPGSWSLERLADHLTAQRQYVIATYSELGPDDETKLNAWVQQHHWQEFVPENATAAHLAIRSALQTAATARTQHGMHRPAWSCYLDALIQVYVPGAPGQAGVAVMNYVDGLSPEPNLLGFLHTWRTLTRLLPALGTDVSDTFRRNWLLRKLPPQMQGQLNARLMEERNRGSEPTFNRTFDLAVELAPLVVPPPILGAIAPAMGWNDHDGHQHDHQHDHQPDLVGALQYHPSSAQGGGRPAPGRRLDSRNPRHGRGRQGGNQGGSQAGQPPQLPRRLSRGAGICYGFAFRGACPNPTTCQYAHDEAALAEYLSQLETELSSLRQGAALRGTGPQRLQHLSR